MRAYERLLQYVQVHTTSDPLSGTHPSTQRQFDLARMLVEELQALGVEDAAVDEHCYVYGTLPPTPGCEDRPALGLIAHMDTAPDASGENVRPVLHQDYDGRDVTLPATGAVMRVKDFPFLASMKGETLITTDGSTLLGADDKAGVAEIFTAVEYLAAHPEIPHGRIAVAVTPDEEVGSGADHFDVDGFGAAAAYTVDGGELGELEYENFNAASAKVTIRGFNIHPGSAKDKMRNACLMALEFVNMLPPAETPAHTEGYEGFFHLGHMEGDETEARLSFIIRDHDRDRFESRKERINLIAAYLNEKYGPTTVQVELKDSYYNMKAQIEPHMYLIHRARAAFAKVGVEAVEVPIRGGTDGARLSYMGLPCPNLSTGGANFHGVMEYIPVQSMEKMVQVLVELVTEQK